MMLMQFTRGQGSIILRVKIRNSSVSTGAGLTGLSASSAGLIISTIADTEASPTAYTQAAGTIETIGDGEGGTYSAPTAGKCRFGEVLAASHPGIYEIQLADARYVVAGAKSLLVSIHGAANCAEMDATIPLLGMDPYDGVRGGMIALPPNAADAAGGMVVSDAGGLDMDALYAFTVSSSAWGYINSGVVFRGLVTAADPGVSFTIGGLAGQGVGAFIDATTPWYAYVFRDAGGAAAAPQGEQQVITGYTSATGLFTTAAFTQAVAVGDDVIVMTGRLASIPDILTDTGTTLPATLVALDALIDAIKAKTDLLGTGSATVSAPVDADGKVTIRPGNDYSNTDGLALEWTSITGKPDLTGAALQFVVTNAANVIEIDTTTGTVVTPTDPASVYIELTHAESVKLTQTGRQYDARYELRATLPTNLRQVTLAADLARSLFSPIEHGT